jgi:DNA-directed RNA polymerase beta subunit
MKETELAPFQLDVATRIMADVADEFADEATLQAYGASSVKELSAPVKALEEKWKLIPAFQRVRGLVKQHIASFDQFVNQELKKILATNAEIRSDVRLYAYWMMCDVD